MELNQGNDIFANSKEKKVQLALEIISIINLITLHNSLEGKISPNGCRKFTLEFPWG